jgi:hypothetical protein
MPVFAHCGHSDASQLVDCTALQLVDCTDSQLDGNRLGQLFARAVRVSTKLVSLAASLVIGVLIVGIELRAAARTQPAGSLKVSTKARLAAIRRAKVWAPTRVGSMDLKAGPAGSDSFAPNELITCKYVDKPMSGATPKFTCVAGQDDELKVKYGVENGEVYAEVAATRLLWALGFGADRVYPVRVACHGCSADPHTNKREAKGQVLFDPAAVERKMKGIPIEVSPDSGWVWPELDEVQEAAGGAPLAHRDALKLLAVFIQHTDNKAAQQRLVCVGGDEDKGDVPCEEPWMIVQDLGLTFGRANLFNRNAAGSVNFDQWSQTPIWTEAAGCIGNLAPSQSGSLESPIIGEAGRKFLADLLVQLSDAQLRDLFEAARFPQRKAPSVRAATSDQWVEAFKKKRDQIVNRSCSS